MSYRSLKRVLGETSLERKCRILFGISLLILIATAFFYAGRRAEKLVTEGPRRTGQSFVREKLASYHWPRLWAQEADDAEIAAAKRFQESLGTGLFEWKFLVLDDRGLKAQPESRGKEWDLVGEDDPERAIMEDLRRRVDLSFESYGREKLIASEPGGRNELAVREVLNDPTSPFNDPPTHLIEDVDAENYIYYQPILWESDCTFCHSEAAEMLRDDTISRYAYSYEQWTTPDPDNPEVTRPDTLRVMKIVMPSKTTQREIWQTRSILSALAIATVFFSMIALYVVVRYVIVKPLNHLREVSDEISRGNYDLRARIQTSDEFEELADSFNRMLRHLTDTQAELRAVNKDHDRKIDELAQANMQLHEMNRMKSDFLSSMSHELRTPLNSIIGFADVLKENDSLNDKQKRYAGNIGSSGRSLLEMINDILDLAKAESGKMEVRLTEFQLDPVVNSQCDLVRSLSEEKNIDLSAHVEQELPPLYQDQGKLQQILINLLSNAIKFTPEGGRITVRANRDSMRHLVLTVEDTGVGIAEEERRVIFEKFRQGTRTVGTDHLTREFSGSGLGLSIVKELSRLLGGEVDFESELGKGSTFRVRVPWTLADRPKRDTSIQQRLSEVTKPRPIDFSNRTTNSFADESSESDPETTDGQVAR